MRLLVVVSLLVQVSALTVADVDASGVMPDSMGVPSMSNAVVEENAEHAAGVAGSDSVASFATFKSVEDDAHGIIKMSAEHPPGTMPELAQEDRADMNDYNGNKGGMSEPKVVADREIPTVQEEAIMNNADKIPPAIGEVKGYKPPCKEDEAKAKAAAKADAKPNKEAAPPKKKAAARSGPKMETHLLAAAAEKPEPTPVVPNGAKILVSPPPKAKQVPAKTLKPKKPEATPKPEPKKPGFERNIVYLEIPGIADPFEVNVDPQMTGKTVKLIINAKLAPGFFDIFCQGKPLLPETRLYDLGMVDGAYCTALPVPPPPKKKAIKPSPGPFKLKSSPPPVSLPPLQTDPFAKSDPSPAPSADRPKTAADILRDSW